MNISRHIHLSLYGAAMLGLAACSESDTPLAPDSESGTELEVSPAPLPGGSCSTPAEMDRATGST